jgi:hypothetical protein
MPITSLSVNKRLIPESTFIVKAKLKILNELEYISGALSFCTADVGTQIQRKNTRGVLWNDNLKGARQDFHLNFFFFPQVFAVVLDVKAGST